MYHSCVHLPVCVYIYMQTCVHHTQMHILHILIHRYYGSSVRICVLHLLSRAMFKQSLNDSASKAMPSCLGDAARPSLRQLVDDELGRQRADCAYAFLHDQWKAQQQSRRQSIGNDIYIYKYINVINVYYVIYTHAYTRMYQHHLHVYTSVSLSAYIYIYIYAHVYIFIYASIC